MSIAIPGLSPSAEDALRELSVAMKKKNGRLDVAAGSLDPAISKEFATAGPRPRRALLAAMLSCVESWMLSIACRLLSAVRLR